MHLFFCRSHSFKLSCPCHRGMELPWEGRLFEALRKGSRGETTCHRHASSRPRPSPLELAHTLLHTCARQEQDCTHPSTSTHRADHPLNAPPPLRPRPDRSACSWPCIFVLIVSSGGSIRALPHRTRARRPERRRGAQRQSPPEGGSVSTARPPRPSKRPIVCLGAGRGDAGEAVRRGDHGRGRRVRAAAKPARECGPC